MTLQNDGVMQNQKIFHEMSAFQNVYGYCVLALYLHVYNMVTRTKTPHHQTSKQLYLDIILYVNIKTVLNLQKDVKWLDNVHWHQISKILLY